MPFDGTNLNEVAAHLLRAKRYIEEHGWSPNGSCVGDAVCVLQAINNTGTPQFVVTTNLFERANNLPYCGAPIWNDTPGRTLEEVYAAFDAAIALAMAEEKVG